MYEGGKEGGMERGMERERGVHVIISCICEGRREGGSVCIHTYIICTIIHKL